ALIENGRLLASTASNATLVPGVDAGPREADVYIDGAWRTILVGSLRLGGRGIYALDVTVPLAGGTETSAAAALPMWEFTSGDVASAADDEPCAAGSTSCPSLGYTYESANVARLNYVAPSSENSWVALVASGYFPQDDEVAANPDDITEAAASRTSLMVIDVQSGRLIREIRTSDAPQARPAGFKTFGLSTPVVYDIASDDIDDLAYAGDLAGNLWRFDLSSPDPDDWTVDLMFTTYGDGGAENVGDQPIVFNPTALRDFPSRRPIIVVGTGKYLGKEDRTSQIPEQAFYGVRDYGTHPDGDMYPIRVNQMVTQVLSEDNTGERQITGWEAPTGTVPDDIPPMLMRGTDPDVPIEEVRAQGWRIELNIPRELGERAQRRPIPLFSSNSAVLYTLIPKNDDPCDPGARYGVMLVNAGTGGALGAENNIVGQVPDDPIPEPPADPTIPRGGGALIIPGLTPLLSDEVKQVLNATIPVWHRGAWRELLDVQ
ncbi:MAG TPA: PilC/PilY family type IV pilus protein, partial [Dokdonella sp.]